MQEPFKFCAYCGTQNNLSAQFCQKCGAGYGGAPPPPARSKAGSPLVLVLSLVGAMFGCCIVSTIIGSLKSNKTTSSTSVTLTSSPAPSGSTWTPVPSITNINAERMVLDNAQVTVYVECTNREWKQYKFRFIVKKSGSPLLTPILRQVGNPNAYSVVVNGVDTGDGDLAFSPNIAAFDRNGKLITADFNTRPLNGNEALGRAYYNLIAKYERGD